MVRQRVRSVVPIVARNVAVMPVRELNHEALPGRIVIPLAGVFRAGEAVGRRQLERAESVRVADPGVVLGPSAVKLFMKKLMSSAIELAVSG